MKLTITPALALCTNAVKRLFQFICLWLMITDSAPITWLGLKFVNTDVEIIQFQSWMSAIIYILIEKSND